MPLDVGEMTVLADYGTMTTTKPGDVIYHEGQASQSFYVVMKGELHAIRLDQEGKSVRVANFGPGDFTGDIATQIGMPSTHGLVAKVRSRLMQIETSELGPIIAAYPSVGNKILEVFVQRWLIRGKVSELPIAAEVSISTPPQAGDRLIHSVLASDHTVDSKSVRDGEAVGTVVYGDYQCPFTWKQQEIFDKLFEDWDELPIRYTFRHFPQLEIHPDSFRAALAAEAADMQGRFWDYHRAQLELRGKLNLETILQTAGTLGLDVRRFHADMDGKEAQRRVQEHLRFAADEGVDTTPTIFLEGNLYSGQLLKSSLSSAMLRVLQKKTSSAT